MAVFSIFSDIEISASGLRAQRRRMNAIASNIANVDTSRTKDGTVYKRKVVLMEEAVHPPTEFATLLGWERNRLSLTDVAHIPEPHGHPSSGLLLSSGVTTKEVAEEPLLPRLIYDPAHPDADVNGYVQLPDINIITEMVDLLAASRAYEANVTVIGASKAIASKALEI
ncbi:MAG: flagellar basal body rod protein FlgC [Candidatus Latescibacteria bacterium]|nr:flagellar basal body rod protein FlgC [Candidatus Latescibacterota bacterium]